MNKPTNVALAGICGSTAHNLAVPGSDKDTRGVYISPTSDLFRFQGRETHYREDDPDLFLHEVGRFVNLALQSNPSATELLWLPRHTVVTDVGAELLSMREAFLCHSSVLGAFLRFAVGHWKWANRPEQKKPEVLNSPVAGRDLKMVRTTIRQLEQGKHLYRTGELDVRVGDRDWYLNVLPGLPLVQVNQLILVLQEQFENTTTVLPDEPDWRRAENFIIDVRRKFFEDRAYTGYDSSTP